MRCLSNLIQQKIWHYCIVQILIYKEVEFVHELSTQPLLPGMQIFSFGYPMSHTEETALFVNGNVSGSKGTLSGHSMAVLNCSLNCGNSGGPVLSWVDGEVRVVGVATQKHFSRIFC